MFRYFYLNLLVERLEETDPFWNSDEMKQLFLHPILQIMQPDRKTYRECKFKWTHITYLVLSFESTVYIHKLKVKQ